MVVDAANEHDMSLFGPTLDALEELPLRRPRPTTARPQGLCLDKGYDYPIIRELCRLFGFVAHIRPRGQEAALIKHRRGYRARRWVVERTHSWLNRFRRLLIRWEKDDLYHLGMLHFACALIAFQQAGVFG